MYYSTDTQILSQSNGSSWTQIAAGVALDLLSAKGDLLTRSSSAYSRLGVGSNDQVLTADSAQSTGLKWATPSSGFSDPTTTKGDLIIHGASTTRLAVGTDYQQLVADSSQSAGVAWATPPAVRCSNSANISTSSGAYSYLTFDTNRFDRGTGTAQHSTSSSTSHLVCQVAGVYQISGDVQFAGSSSGTQRALQVRLNGATAIAQNFAGPQGANTVSLALSTLYLLAAADYLELGAYQDTGGSLNVLAGGNHSPEFMMVRVG